ncbi:Peroxidase [Heracleum sosnowskyi]|uniref:Peroxidase n=1 Tax=Heracleum sosnowskyi TaxID=360622 RepID=A0AAD8JKF1_9APIA|nr:Peroxidase [Heracleum sosnowskyi]
MASQSGNFSVTMVCMICLLIICSANAQLSANYYAYSCPGLQRIVRNALTPNVRRDRRLGASLLRMHFHDCFVNGCDASVLLDDTSSLTGEKNAFPNRNSLRGFDVIDAIKTRVEAACQDTVSCADILALAARDGTVLLGGPSWTVPLGRRDSTTASQDQANNDIPKPFDDLPALITSFANKGLTAKEMTVLSGSHTIGQAQCSSFRAHIYNGTNINAAFARSRQARCPASAPNGDTNLAPLDLQSPNSFGSDYYQNLVAKRGLLHSDQELFNGGSQDDLVRSYSKNNRAFRNDFAAAMIKMGNISPLTGTNGEIRKNCRVPN